MSTATLPGVLTAEEYALLDDVDGFRDELIEGERVLSPSAGRPHGAVIKRLERILESQLNQLSSEPVEVVREEGWKFRNPVSKRDSVPGPDLMVIREEDSRAGIRERRWFEGVPLITIEVISPSERKAKRLQKAGLYLQMGVAHVIEVDYTKRLVTVHTAEAEAFYREGDEITTPFRAAIADIFSVLD